MLLVNKKELLWLYLPDFEKNGAMDHITSIPGAEEGDPPFWVEDELCRGFEIDQGCKWRYDEMELVSFTPKECLVDKALGCDKLVAHARF